LCAAIGVVSSMVWREANEQGTKTLAATAASVSELLQVDDEAARKGAIKDYAIFKSEFDPVFTLTEERDAQAQAQPRLTNRGVALNGNFDVVDRFTQITGATATVFARTGDDFKRITTSLKKSDGSRAVGTLLDRQHPAYKLMLEGKPYTGRATLFGKKYMTRYEPIVQDGRAIGILYVGSDLSDVLDNLNKSMKAEHPFELGAVYAVDVRPGPTAGEVLGLEPAARLSEKDAAASAFLKRLQEGGESGSFDASWTPRSQAGTAATSRVVYTKNPTWNWVVVSESPESAVTAKAVRTLTVLWIAGLVALVILLITITLLTRRLVGKPIQQLIRSLSHLAQNDLTQAMKSQSNDEIGRLTQSMEQFRLQLVAALSAVHGDANNLANASFQIADGSKNLSLRTGEQIGVLQYTSSAMSELNVTVRGNADSANQATQLASQASAMATKGGEDVQRIVQTMESISASAKTIEGIIAVIDGIAFQTNILALNAAVEAARAGTQGRGFAVVASEVRLLAQRSADAAKDIKSLISGSVQRVEEGVTIVGEAGKSIAGVVGATQRVSDIIGRISVSSSQQSASVAQVTEAVACIDRATQQNVQLVTQSESAAQGLNDQAQRLVQAVSVFQLTAAQAA